MSGELIIKEFSKKNFIIEDEYEIDFTTGKIVVGKNNFIKNYNSEIIRPMKKVRSDFFEKVLSLSSTEDILHKIAAHISGKFELSPYEILQINVELNKRHQRRKSV